MVPETPAVTFLAAPQSRAADLAKTAEGHRTLQQIAAAIAAPAFPYCRRTPGLRPLGCFEYCNNLSGLSSCTGGARPCPY
jgi:hypothetical protein